MTFKPTPHGSIVLSIAVLASLPIAGLAQGIRMSPDFLPLDVGNRWKYAILDSGGRPLDTFEMAITDYTIVEGRSYYVFSQFQFVGADGPVGVRYDRTQRQYVRFDGDQEGDLFPSARSSVEVMATDANGLPLRARFDFGDLVLVLDRGVGIVGGTFVSDNGEQDVQLVGALVGNQPIMGDVETRPAPPLIPTVGATEGLGEISDANVKLEIEAIPDGGQHRLIFRVQNASDQLLAFDFTSSQDFDFVITDPVNGTEIWRWSERRFFSQVTRSEAILPGREWAFEAVWNHRDNAFNEVPPGLYRVVAVLAADNPVDTLPLSIEVQ